jgi:hypothetical protein
VADLEETIKAVKELRLRMEARLAEQAPAVLEMRRRLARASERLARL